MILILLKNIVLKRVGGQKKLSELSTEILSDIIIYSKYARYIKELNRRETFEEICNRVKDMHIIKYPCLKNEIKNIFNNYVKTKKILPSMRSMQFAGVPIVRNNSRVYNCSYLPIDHPDAFSEVMFLLLGGTGVGYSVQYRHIDQLPPNIGNKKKSRRFIIGDSIEGWADAIKVLMESYFYGKEKVNFDFSDIREKGEELITSGGKAPGPGPLKICIAKIDSILNNTVGRQLLPIECHDILCHIADAVLVGGIRRAAMISLFSRDDLDMLSCKSGNWWELNPQRGRANNSVILKRDSISKEKFTDLVERIRLSGAGEPGIYWTNNYDWGTNPCCEIGLKPFQFCNLVEVNVSDVKDQNELDKRVEAASFIATLQAGYTNFHYLRPIWKEKTEEDALIGVGLTGIGSGELINNNISLKEAACHVISTNEKISKVININPASRTTTVKPSGTSSIVLGCSSGVHPWHSKFYIRRIRLGKDEALYKYLKENLPSLVEDDYFNSKIQAVISIPQKAPDKAFFRNEPLEKAFNRAIFFNKEWVQKGYVTGDNQNNVSCTLSVKDNEWGLLKDLLWDYKDFYNGMSVLPYDGGSYKQAPFEEITEDVYNKMFKELKNIDLSMVKEYRDETKLMAEPACAGGACEVI